MIHTFSTREEAAIFASAMRSDGYFAEILDEEMGSIYGPLAIGGVRVLVSDETIEDTDESTVADNRAMPPVPATPDAGPFLQALRLVTVSLVAFGLIALAIFLLKSVYHGEQIPPEKVVQFLKYPLILGLAFAAMGPLMDGFTRWLRGERTSMITGCMRWLVIAALGILLILAVL